MSTGFELQQAALESVRFGIRVERARSTAGAATSPLLEQIRRSSADLIILRTEAGHSELATALQQQGEFVIHADTLVYYGITLVLGGGAAASNVRPATTADRPAIAAIAAASFRGYRSHYSANPLLPVDRVHEGYIEWAQRQAGRRRWQVGHVGRMRGRNGGRLCHCRY